MWLLSLIKIAETVVKSHADPKTQLCTWRASLTEVARGVLPHSTPLTYEGVMAGSSARLAGWAKRLVYVVPTSAACKVATVLSLNQRATYPTGMKLPAPK